jgi:hypothetical protein
VDGDRVRLSWESAEGVPMERARRSGDASVCRLYHLEVETQRLPDLRTTIY